MEVDPESDNTEERQEEVTQESAPIDDIQQDDSQQPQPSNSIADADPSQNVNPSEDNSSQFAQYFWDYKDLDCTKGSTLEKEEPSSPLKITTSTKHEFSARNILKGCKWAPDGSCLITNSDDNTIRIFNLPDSLWNLTTTADVDRQDGLADVPPLEPALKVAEGGPLYDFSWYPFMSSTEPGTCCFLTSAGENPVHLFDAFDGRLRATYLPVNHLEQIVAPHSIEFDLTGNNIYCGFRDYIKIFNLHRPGRDCIERKLKKSSKLPELNQSGIISCFAFNSSYSNVYACGSFQKTIGLYLEDGTVMAILTGHIGGVTHLKFSHDGTKLFSGGRKDSRLIVWDMRNLGEEYQILERHVNTNQRIYFDVTPNDRYLVSGQTNGQVSIWDLKSSTEDRETTDSTSTSSIEQTNFVASTDCVNGISINPRTPVLATTSGQRHFCDIASDSDDEMLFTKPNFPEDHVLALWKFT